MKITGYQTMSASFSRNQMFWNTRQMETVTCRGEIETL